jgi:hypothetical protein
MIVNQHNTDNIGREFASVQARIPSQIKAASGMIRVLTGMVGVPGAFADGLTRE